MWCNDCIFLNKSKKQMSENGTSCFRYGCDTRIDEYICGWITEDKELKTMGCSCSNKLKIGHELVVRNRAKGTKKTFIYCGKIDGNPLLYCSAERKYRIVSVNCLRTQKGKIKENIRIEPKDKEQFEKNRKKAKMLKRWYLEDLEENTPFN